MLKNIITLILSLTLTFFFLSYHLHGQSAMKGEVQFENLSTKNEDLQTSINCITQDKRGYLWIGGWLGLYKYDGIKIQLYKQEKDTEFSLKGTKIRTMLVDRHGVLWVGTMNDGLHRFDREKEQFIQYKHNPKNTQSLSSDDITSLFEDNKGTIWVGTLNGLNKLEERPKTKEGKETADSFSFVRFKINERHTSLSVNRVNVIHQDNKGRYWVGTETGLYQFDPGKATFSKIVVGTTDNNSYIYSLIETTDVGLGDKRTVLWAGTRAGLKKLIIDNTKPQIANNFALTNYAYKSTDPQSLSHNRVRTVFQSRYDTSSLWVGTEDGLNKLNIQEGKFTRYKANYKDPHSLNNNIIHAFYEDQSGILWIGTEKGINKLDHFRKKFLLYQASEEGNPGLSNNFISSFALSPSNTLWVGTNGGGLNKVILDSENDLPTQIKKISIQEKNSDQFSNYIYSICTDKKGSVWVGTNGGGIFRFLESDVKNSDEEISKYIQYNSTDSKNGLQDNYVLCLREDKKGDIWVGTWSGGVSKYDHKQDKFIRLTENKNTPKILSKTPISFIYEDRKDNIWIGTRGAGLFKLTYDATGSSHFTQFIYNSLDRNSLSNNFITFVHEDKFKNLWVGTEAGLNKFHHSSSNFTTYSEKEGLPSGILQSLQEDQEGNLWISTNKGISKFEYPSEKRKDDRKLFMNYDKDDGLQGNIFNNTSSAITKKGLMFFGGINGINAFHPLDIRDNINPPQIEITNFLIFNKEVPVGANAQGRVILKRTINETKEIELLYNDNSISFEFASMHFASPAKNQYAYKMDGFDEDWIYTDASRNYAYYTNLNPGNYTFKVKASNNDGIWSKDEASINITIHPPFWKTKTAYFLYFICIIILLYFLKRMILIRADFRHSLMLERVKRENVESLNQLKIRFFTNVSHEIRTPLTLILGSLDRVLNSSELSTKIHGQLLVMQKHGELLLKLISQLLDFRKMEAGHLTLKASHGNIIHFLKDLFVAFEELAMERQIKYNFVVREEEIKLWFDKDKLEKIVFNLLSNAFKYTKDRGEISLKINVVDVAEVEGNSYTSITDAYVKICIQDNGIGISQRHLDKIFDLYYQAENNNAYQENTGTGIGLSLSKSLVELHKGKITVTSEEGKGSCFSVYLPLGKAHLKESDIIEDVTNEVNGHNSIAANKQLGSSLVSEAEDENEGKEIPDEFPIVLIVEDNKEVRNFIKQTFEEEYKILEASNGAEGLALALERVPDLIISDVLMPEMDGLELCNKIKTDERTCHIPLILLTARASLPYKTEGLEIGADDYITKPFNSQLLMLKVRNLLRLKHNLIHRFGNKKFLTPKEVTTNPLDETFLKKAIDIVGTQMHNPDFNVEDFGKELGMSRMQLYRKLKALTGLSANEFVRNQRIQRAAQLLARKELNIAEVTYEVGFTDLKYFRKCFKEYYNVNPSEYMVKEEK